MTQVDALPRRSSRSVRLPWIAGIAAVGLAYITLIGWLAREAAYGNDELFTYYFARLPGMRAVWDELGTGVEQTPPFFYLVTRSSLRVFGDTPFGLRFPELIGTLLAAGCVLTAVARRTSMLIGSVAALLLLATQATFYAHEARPYALTLGFVAAAYLCWQVHIDREQGSLVTVLFGLSLAAAVATHYYAVLALLPFAAGEAVRLVQRRRLDVPVLGALAISLVPLVVAAPLVQAARTYSNTFWTVVPWDAAITFNGWLFRTAAVSGRLAPRLELSLLVWVVAGLAAHALFVAPGGRTEGHWHKVAGAALPALGVTVLAGHALVSPSLQAVVFTAAAAACIVLYAIVARTRAAAISARARAAPVPFAELVLLASFFAVPPLAVAVAKLSTGAYTPRYVLPAALGVACLLPLALDRLCGSRRIAPAIALVALALFVVRVGWSQHLELRVEAEELAATAELAARVPDRRLPVVVGHPQRYFRLAHDPPPALEGRLLHLSSLELARRYTGVESTEAGLLELSRFAPLDVRAFEPYVATGRPFLLLVTEDDTNWNWIVPALEASGRSLEVVASDGDNSVLRVG